MAFVTSQELNAGFHDEVIRALLAGTPYAAGLLGWGSDVLGYDTARSTDHGWGPRLCVFVDEDRVAEIRQRVDEALPDEFGGFPDQLWRWLLACQWRRLDQEEPFVQRTAETGDELGSAIVAARQVREVIRLALLQARHYAPYSKWLGTAFTRLDNSDGLDRALATTLAATSPEHREQALCTAYEIVARRHNALGITEELDTTVRRFHDRPARVLGASRFVDACLDTVTDPFLKAQPLVGSVDQIADSTDVLSAVGTAKNLRGIYEAGQ